MEFTASPWVTEPWPLIVFPGRTINPSPMQLMKSHRPRQNPIMQMKFRLLLGAAMEQQMRTVPARNSDRSPSALWHRFANHQLLHAALHGGDTPLEVVVSLRTLWKPTA